MRYLPKMQQLRVFEEVVRQGSIRSAARTLAQSQPAISRALKELENTLQTALFLRGPAGITLTPSGQLFAVRNRFILHELQRAGDEIYSAQHPQQGKVAVGFCSLIGSTLLAEVVEKFRLRLPQARLTVKEGQLRSLLPLLNSGEIDFAAGPVPNDLQQERLVITPLFQVPLCVVASNNHPARRARALSQLSGQKWLLAEDASATLSSLNDELKRFFQALPQPALRTSSLLSAIELVERAGYLMLLPEPVVSRWSHNLVQLPIGTLPALQYGALCSSHSPLTAGAQQLLKILEKASGRYAWRSASGKNSTPALFPLC